jgi:hypothetical protein
LREGDLSGALGARRSGLETHDVRVQQPELGDVFECDDPFGCGDQRGKR